MQIRKRGRLPHWEIKDGSYFVTFNLHDAFPAEYRNKLERERRIRLSELERVKGNATPAELHAVEQLIRERLSKPGFMPGRWFALTRIVLEVAGRDARSPCGIGECDGAFRSA